MDIHVVSRLYHKPAAAWLGALRNFEQARLYMVHQYRPMREAIVRELQEPGRGQEQLTLALETREKIAGQERVDQYNQEAFHTFQAQIQPRIRGVEENFLEVSYDPSPVVWEGYPLQGRFHCAVRDEYSVVRYCYFHASKWDPEETQAFTELLAILAEMRHWAGREKVWFIDLKQGKIIEPAKHFKKLRADLQRTMELYMRLESALHAEIG